MNKAVLVILDGFGINEKKIDENAIIKANTPTFDKLFSSYYSKLGAHGHYVGVPDKQIGSSEIGHMTIGSGRIIKQSIVKIDDMFDSGEFEKLKEYKKGIENCKNNGSNLHILQIFGPGGVHGSDSHLKKLLKIIPQDIEVYLHLFGDGRDLAPDSAFDLMVDFEKYLEEYPNVKIATFSGRYYAMDRDNNRERTQKAYDEIVFGVRQTSDSPSEFIRKCYESEIPIMDEFIEPVSFVEGEKIANGDSIFFLNFRSDRSRQIARAFMHSIDSKESNTNFHFITKNFKNIYFVTMTKYYSDYDGYFFIKDDIIKNTLGEIISNNEFRQLHIAETEKYAHVTKFFNGGQQIVYDGERDILVPSSKVATYDLKPEMSAQEIYNQFEKNANGYDFVVINFANGDMVGHTGILNATKIAIEKLDELIQKIISFCSQNNFELLITADHGNCEEMGTDIDPKTAHTTNKVPCRYVVKGENQKIKDKGGLADIAPTVLEIMGIDIPKEMSGKSLIS
ncbi:2,3-bisphosphoglycerate-independent phosphoglycerate mutase [Candidatus Gracilibacteria bacterium]|nr:2,3-bisphosphoglycerate-independent phosphoglycerate mutase [Candidatus Gracilibacteria bacterium]